MADQIIQKDGRIWTVDENGLTSLSRRYVVALDGDALSADGEVSSWPGIPVIGSAHPTYSDLSVISYNIQEGEGNERRLIDVTVNYSINYGPDGVPDQADGESLYVEQWGWDSGTTDRELLMDCTQNDPQPVANSIGDPFETAPTVQTPAPVFTKVMKFKTRQSGWNDYMCTINDSAVTIGGISFPKWTLLCDVVEQRIFGDGAWRYKYTVRLSYKSNKVKLKHESEETEVGWNIAIADAGMRELGQNNKIELITLKDSKTNERYAVTSPMLLDGSGHQLSATQEQGQQNARLEPYNVMFYAYPQADFPSWFYSEPAMDGD